MHHYRDCPLLPLHINSTIQLPHPSQAQVSVTLTSGLPYQSQPVYSSHCDILFPDFFLFLELIQFVTSFLCWTLFLFPQLPLFLTLFPGMVLLQIYPWDTQESLHTPISHCSPHAHQSDPPPLQTHEPPFLQFLTVPCQCLLFLLYPCLPRSPQLTVTS